VFLWEDGVVKTHKSEVSGLKAHK